MAPKFTQSKVNAAVRQLRTASNDLRRYGQQLEAARCELDRENRRVQSRLRPLQRSQPRLSVSEQRLLQSVRGHVTSDRLTDRTTCFCLTPPPTSAWPATCMMSWKRWVPRFGWTTSVSS